ncbi:hypothetical protein EYZ11_011680 [Aspergillus tanneri]|uniref:Uncharacterized protein n=1 Tax=Aspergillus tanneri TaxID=1220188 RepID=A0A4S3J2S1_9EURO|nr:hypothetical protein EYZ11_011680 [Aspergillus tanneri]
MISLLIETRERLQNLGLSENPPLVEINYPDVGGVPERILQQIRGRASGANTPNHSSENDIEKPPLYQLNS